MALLMQQQKFGDKKVVELSGKGAQVRVLLKPVRVKVIKVFELYEKVTKFLKKWQKCVLDYDLLIKQIEYCKILQVSNRKNILCSDLAEERTIGENESCSRNISANRCRTSLKSRSENVEKVFESF